MGFIATSNKCIATSNKGITIFYGSMESPGARCPPIQLVGCAASKFFGMPLRSSFAPDMRLGMFLRFGSALGRSNRSLSLNGIFSQQGQRTTLFYSVPLLSSVCQTLVQHYYTVTLHSLAYLNIDNNHPNNLKSTPPKC